MEGVAVDRRPVQLMAWAAESRFRGAERRWRARRSLAAVSVVVTAMATALPSVSLNVGAVRALPALVCSGAAEPDACSERANLQAVRGMLSWGAYYSTSRGRAYLMRGRVEDAYGCRQEAVSWLREAAREAPNDVIVAFTLGEVLQALGNSEAAVRAWQSVPQIAQKYVFSAGRAVRAQAWVTAVREARLAVAIDPHDPGGRRWLGLGLAFGQSRWEEGVRELREARALGEPDAYVTVEIAHVLQIAGKEEEAVQELSGYTGASALAESIRGQYYMRKGRLDEAVRVLKKSVELEPAEAWSRKILAEVYARQGKRKLAVEQLEAALRTNPAFQPGRDLLGCISTAGDVGDCVGR